MTTNSSSQDNGHLESPKSSPTREVREDGTAFRKPDYCPHGVDLVMNVCHRCDGTAIYTEQDLTTTRQAARDELLNELLAELPEKIKFPVIPDMGPGVPESFAQGYGRGEAAGHNQALSAVRTLLSKKKETK